MSRFLLGLSAPVRGLRTIAAHRELWPFAIAPSLVTGALLSLALYVAVTGSGPAIAWLIPSLRPGSVLFAIGQAAMMVLLIVVLGLTATMSAALLCIPINDALAQRIEALRGALPTPLSLREALPASVAHSVLGFALWLLCQGMLLPLQAVPVAGWILELVGGWGITCFFLGHQLLDGPMSRRRMGFGAKLAWMWQHLGAVLGLGATGTLMVAIPVLNAVGLPIAVAGGTLLWLELEEPDTPGPDAGEPDL